MQKQAPTLGRVLVMAIFALSCFSLLLYLWSAFGGPVPLKPHGYRFTASFAEATQLAQEADVRISGVSVGKVKKITLGKDGRSQAVIELDQKYAPLPSDSRAILRQKTLLGETYVELTPGTKTVKPIPEGGRLASAHVAPTVELDEIFRSFDRKTRDSFRVWMQDQGAAIVNRGADFNDFLGNLPAFADTSNQLLSILNSQKRATQQLIKNTGVVFDALSERDGQLRDWIVNSNRVFQTTAQRDEQIRQTFIALPRFIDESEKTLRRLVQYADNTNPLLVKLRPVGKELSYLLVNAKPLAPDFKQFFVGLNGLARASRSGLPAASSFLDDTRPLLAQLDPFLRNLNPFLRYIGAFKHELTAFFANFTAATQGTAQEGSRREHFLRLVPPLEPEALGIYSKRLGSNRSNPYTLPGEYNNIAQGGLDIFNSNLCGTTGFPDLAPASASFPEDLRNKILQFFLNNGNTIAVPCHKQGKFNFGGETTDFPHVNQDSKPANPYDILKP